MLGRKWTIRSKQRESCQTAYVKQYEASSDFTFPEEFDLSAHNILLSESIRTGSATTVLLYWISKARSQAQEPVVAKILGLRNGQVVGEVIQVLAPRMPKWTENPVKWGNWIVGAAALFGALTVIRDNFTELFARPNVVIFAANSAVKNFHVGDPLDIPLVVRNQARLGQVEVSLTDVHLQPSDGVGSPNTLKFDTSQVPDGIALMSGATSIGAPMVVTGSAGSVAKIQFQTGPIQPFHRYLYAVQIAFPHPLTTAEWNSLCSSMKVVFG
jgi:hypothetical protein